MCDIEIQNMRYYTVNVDAAHYAWLIIFKPTPVRGGLYFPPLKNFKYFKNNDPKGPEFCDFSDTFLNPQ